MFFFLQACLYWYCHLLIIIETVLETFLITPVQYSGFQN